MNFKMIPNDIPLPLPDMGLSFIEPVFQALLVVSWVVHILFINVLLGASFGSVYFNSKGVKTNNPVLDRVAYLLTTPVTISENMGALWGVAPLLLVSVLFTPLFYAASIMNSPHWLHIIYGNIAAFLLSYLYKFTWHTLENRKSLHLVIGTISVGLFFTLPPVFMATVQLYITPTTWTYETHFWDALLRPDTFFRLLHFYFASFAVTGIFMLIYGFYKRKSEGELDKQAGDILVSTGKSWFLVPTVLNFFIGPLVLFSFPSYGLESFFNAGYYWLIILSIVLALIVVYMLVKDFFNPDISAKKLWTVVGLIAIVILSMATLRHGMRLSLTDPAIAEAKAKSLDFQQRAQDAKKEAANEPVTPVVQTSAGETLANKHGCLACHSVENKIVGPSYREVAKKGYDQAKIVALIKTPQPANWADYPPMPAMPQVPDEDLKEIANWINGLK
jgi:cytochrome c